MVDPIFFMLENEVSENISIPSNLKKQLFHKHTMHELFYCSYAAPEIRNEDILDILEVSRRNNEQLGITGILLYWKKTNEFLQVLEGERQVIFDLYEIILKDPRHSLLKLVYHGEIQERGFKNWSMAFKDLKEVDTSQLDGFSDFSTLGFTDERTHVQPSTAVNLIHSFQALLP